MSENRKSRFNPEIEAQIASALNTASSRGGIREVRHAAMKWCNWAKKKGQLEERREEIRAELKELDQELG